MAVNQQHLTAYRETSVLASLSGRNDVISLIGYSSVDHHAYMETLLAHQGGNDNFLNYLLATPWESHAMPAGTAKLFSNGAMLGDAIRAYYGMGDNEFFEPGQVSWVGADTSLAPADIVINGDLWSLKDGSQILHNTSAASLANICLGTETYGRGSIHVFADFATSHDDALLYCVHAYNVANPGAMLPVPVGYADWSKQPTLVRKTLSRWINDVTKDATNTFAKDFAALKNTYNTQAGINYLKHILPTNLGQIESGKILGRDKAHFYASIGNKDSITVGKIPDRETINQLIKVRNVYSVPGKQLDIYIEFYNQRGETFRIQCEMRYSHGQFSSNPECKMKIAKNHQSLVDFLA